MKRKEPTNTLMMISNLRNPLVSMVYIGLYKNISALWGLIIIFIMCTICISLCWTPKGHSASNCRNMHCEQVHSSRHKTLNQCLFNVGPPSQWTNVKQTFIQLLVSAGMLYLRSRLEVEIRAARHICLQYRYRKVKTCPFSVSGSMVILTYIGLDGWRKTFCTRKDL